MRKIFFYPVFVFLILLFEKQSFSQCSGYAVSLEQRVNNSAYIIKGTVVNQHCYIDANTGSVNTLNKIRISAWLKNYQPREEIYLTTLGGVLGNRATKVFPSLQVTSDNEYIFFLDKEDKSLGDPNIRKQQPGQWQLLSYADAQGAIRFENDGYKDLFTPKPIKEETLFRRIEGLCNQRPVFLFSKINITPHKLTPPIISCPPPAYVFLFPDVTNAGTVDSSDFVTVFDENCAGTPYFTGTIPTSPFVYITVNSDLYFNPVISFNMLKVPEDAGTGNYYESSTNTTGAFTINYSHLSLYSNYSGFSQVTRQRYYLRNMNGSGGYSFLYNNSFNANTAAANAFSRAISTWKCATGVNINKGGTTGIATVAADGSSVVMFDNTLPAGVFARTTSQYNADATGTCNLLKTVWYMSETDFQFNDPPKAGFTWQYGPSLPSASEYDFESISLHELGHAIGLGHRNAVGEVMNYSIAAGASSRVPFTHEVEGVVKKLSYSTIPTCFNPVGSGTPMILASCALPVTMGTLTGTRADKNTDQLNWSTYQEINNQGFSIQRSPDGLGFSNIGFVAGFASSNTQKNYLYKDITAGEYPWFYRLLITSLDGQIKYSNVVYVAGYKNTDWKVWLMEKAMGINIYKDPSIKEEGVFQLFSASGQQLITTKINTTNTTVPVNNFAKGIYYYRLISNSATLSGKLVLEF
jgi:hypothetical protein